LTLDIIGGGLAGCAAAIEARRAEASVRLFEQSAFPRHKVCGEFLSAEALPLLERLGVRVEGARVTRVRLHLGRSRKVWRLTEPALGISRHSLDHKLLLRAEECGTEVVRERGIAGDILACGRRAAGAARPRLFGFKAHFTGPADDALDLFFGRRFYAGVVAVEFGRINVCGLAPEDLLREHGFAPDALVAPWTRGLERSMPWLFTGPLELGDSRGGPGSYRAGDALGFIDPFTGSGMLAALSTGMLAGAAAASRISSVEYEFRCRRALAGSYRAAWIFRELMRYGVADWLAQLTPGKWLYFLTRPRLPV
jgi:hypothetical protein